MRGCLLSTTLGNHNAHLLMNALAFVYIYVSLAFHDINDSP